MNKLQANICLICVTICWSAESIIFHAIPDELHTFAFVGVTDIIGSILLFLFFAKRVIKGIREGGLKQIIWFIVMAAFNCAYSVLIIEGGEYFAATGESFIVSSMAFITPIILVIMRRKVEQRAWIAAAFTVTGVLAAVLSFISPEQVPGLRLLIPGVILRSFFYIKVSDLSRVYDPLTMASVVAFFAGLFGLGGWVFLEGAAVAEITWSGMAIAIMAAYVFFIVILAHVVNFFAQRYADPSTVAVIFSTEIAFTALMGIGLPAQYFEHIQLTPGVVIGCALIIVGAFVQSISIKRIREEESEDTEVDEVDSKDPLTTINTVIAKARGSHRLRHGIAQFLMLTLLYVVVSMPFKAFVIVEGFTDLRPVEMFMPMYGIFFGLPGSMAFAVGNLITDVLSGQLYLSSIAGFIANFFGPYAIYLFCVRYAKKRFRLRSRRSILRYAVVVVLVALAQALVISLAVAWLYPEVDVMLLCFNIVVQESLFMLTLGVAIVIMFQEEFGVPVATPWHRHPVEDTI